MKNSIYRLCDLPLKGGDVYKFVYSVSVFTAFYIYVRSIPLLLP